MKLNDMESAQMTNYMHGYFYNSLEMLVNIEGKGNISLPFIHRGTFKD